MQALNKQPLEHVPKTLLKTTIFTRYLIDEATDLSGKRKAATICIIVSRYSEIWYLTHMSHIYFLPDCPYGPPEHCYQLGKPLCLYYFSCQFFQLRKFLCDSSL